MDVSCQRVRPSCISLGINFSDVEIFFKDRNKDKAQPAVCLGCQKNRLWVIANHWSSSAYCDSIAFQPCCFFPKAGERLVKTVEAHSHSQGSAVSLNCAGIRITEPDINSSFSWKEKEMLAKKMLQVYKSFPVLEYQRAGSAEPSPEQCRTMHSHCLEMMHWEHLPAACTEPLLCIHQARHTQGKEEMQRLEERMVGGREQKGAVVNATRHLLPLPAEWSTTARTDQALLQLLSVLLSCLFPFCFWSSSSGPPAQGVCFFHQIQALSWRKEKRILEDELKKGNQILKNMERDDTQHTGEKSKKYFKRYALREAGKDQEPRSVDRISVKGREGSKPHKQCSDTGALSHKKKKYVGVHPH